MIPFPLRKSLTWGNKILRLNLAFDVVLRISCLEKETLFTGNERLDLMLEMLVKDYGKIKRLGIQDKAEILKKIISEFIAVKSKPAGDDTKLVDFGQDASYIFASFYQAYGIDLQKELGRLDWREFIALFQGLPDDTKIKQIMNIRGRKIPQATKYNSEEIKELREAKAYYAIEISDEEAEQNFQRGLDKLAAKLKIGAQASE